jgi:hypothetical protein
MSSSSLPPNQRQRNCGNPESFHSQKALIKGTMARLGLLANSTQRLRVPKNEILRTNQLQYSFLSPDLALEIQERNPGPRFFWLRFRSAPANRRDSGKDTLLMQDCRHYGRFWVFRVFWINAQMIA